MKILSVVHNHIAVIRDRAYNAFTLLEGIIAIGVISSALMVGLTLAISNLQAADANRDRIIANHLAREGLEAVRNMRDSNWMRRDENIDKDSVTPGIQFYAWNDFFNAWPNFTFQTDPSQNYGRFYDVYTNVINIGDSPAAGSSLYTLHKVQPQESPAELPDIITCIQHNQESCKIKKRGSFYYQSNTAPDLANDEHYTNMYRRVQIKDVCITNDVPGKIIVSNVNENTSNENAIGSCPNNLDSSPMQKIGELVISRVLWRNGDKILEVLAKERLYNWK